MTAPKVRIADVTLSPTRPYGLSDRDIDTPAPGELSDAYCLRIGGWVIGNGQSVTAFELVHDSTILETVPALPSFEDEHGARIALAISSIELPYEFRVAVQAVLANGTRGRVARLTGTRAPLPAGPTEGPTPVLITTIGRSGSTVVSNLLCHHPDFAGYRPWETETRMLSYWASVLRGLARPASYERQLQQPLGPGMQHWWVGEPPHANLPAEEPGLAVLEGKAVEGLADFCRSQIGLVGRALAGTARKPEAGYLVEKAQPDPVRSVAEVCEELDPRTREIIVVRDLRDTVCSMRAYSQKTGVVGFGPGNGATMEDSIRWLGEVSAKSLVDYVERRRDAAHLLRYEDLINRPRDTLAAVLRFAGADAAPATVGAMLDRLAGERARFESHATTDSARHSLGRWRRELDEAEQALAEEVLRPQLDALGYS